MALYLRYAVRSDLGLVRNNNEDSVYAGPRLLAIADGMGGHAAGEVASKIVIGTLEQLDEDRRIDDMMRTLRESVADANQRISEAIEARQELEGMGTTLTALRFTGSKVGLVHVGDSRAYLLRGDQLAQITHDDTYVQYLVDSGKLTPDEAKDHPRKSVILRALLGTEVEPDVAIREARAGDRYLLCSDGLSDVVSTETILDTLGIEDTQECADRLVELALRGGGPDNVTVIVADVINAKVGDTVDDVPVIAGAFVDPAAADVPSADSSAAERAAAMSRPAQSQPARENEDVEPRRKRSWKPWLIVAAALVLIAAALAGTYAWTQTQYFVGRAGSDVAVYRGVPTDLGPLKFFNVHQVTDLRMRDLNSSARGQVRDGITAGSEKEADSIVGNLRKQKLPPCGSATSAASPTTTPSSGTSGAVTPAVRPSTPSSGKPSDAVPSSLPVAGTAKVSVPKASTSGLGTAVTPAHGTPAVRTTGPKPAANASSPATTTAPATTADPAPTSSARTKHCSGTP
ncbi:protein phosphatase 2C domain-containing protein [uncultured Jatrophihabitans sp.]|uniref:protein phosphatase 2C domain-containing protein n=1 Tax=uncultured Jatrophihabitans sp. TaxID=1610747 RepID=UPI0035CB01EA